MRFLRSLFSNQRVTVVAILSTLAVISCVLSFASATPMTILSSQNQDPPVNLFQSLNVELTPRGVADSLINLRDFVIKGSGAQLILNDKIDFHFAAPIVKSTDRAFITCSNGQTQLPTTINPDNTGFVIAFQGQNLPVGSNVEISCGRQGQSQQNPTMWLDFNINRGQVIAMTATAANGSSRSSAQLGPIDDPIPLDIKWPFKFNIPVRTAYQPFVTLDIDNIPTFADSETNTYNLIVSFSGVQTRNTPSLHHDEVKSLHFVTMTSYRPNIPTPDQTGLPITSIDPQQSLTIPLTFPKDSSRWGVSVQVALMALDPKVSVSAVLQTTNLATTKSYHPDATTVTSWSYTATPTVSPIEIKFGEYIGHDAKRGQPEKERGPIIELYFPKTATPMINSIFSLSTNSSLFGIEHFPAFYIDPTKKKAHKCRINEFKHDVHAELDFHDQTVLFNFTGIEQLRETAKSFTLSCPDLAVIPAPLSAEAKKNKKAENVPISFLLHGSDELHQAFASSFVGIPPRDPGHGGGYGMAVFILILLVIVGLGGFVGWKLYKKKQGQQANRQFDQHQNTEDLIGYQPPTTDSAANNNTY